jgi:HD-like signal output (HDOD) protein
MVEKSKLTPSQWIEVLAKKELPAITSIASVLDKFSNDDVSSIPKLSKVILHDQALSSCVLRVANSSTRASVNKVTTVSRAAIVLGIHSIKNICLTSKILEGLLQSKNLDPPVYDRLMMLMANAFYAGMLARIMVPNYDENTQEEVYLAAMLYHIGETSFWSTGSGLTKTLINKVHMPDGEFKKYCASMMGINFKDLSVGLAKTWNLSDMLLKSLDHPESRTNEMKIISYSNQLASAISSPPRSKAEFDKLLKDISILMKTDVPSLKVKIEHTRNMALELLSSYDASVLESYLRPLPKPTDFGPELANKELQNLNKEQALLVALQKLTQLSKDASTINSYITQALKDAAQIFTLDRCSFWVLSADKSKLETRLNFDSQGLPVMFPCVMPINQNENVLSYALHQSNGVLIEDYQHVKWRNYMTADIERLINNGSMAITPVKIGQKEIGVITSHCFDKSQPISEVVFSELNFLFDHLNLYLSVLNSKR